MAAAQPVSAQLVGNAFVQQYYHILHHSPGLAYRFYQDISKLGRPEDDGSMSVTTTMQAINEKILSHNYADIRAEIQLVDAQESLNGGVHVLVTGYLVEKETIRNFTQTFFLAPQDKGYFVLNDMFRYVENATHHDTNSAATTDVVAPVTLDQNHPPVLENHISEQSASSAEEDNKEELYNPPENGEVPVVEEEVPVAEVVDESQNESQVVVESDIKVEVVESDTKVEEVPKKSYASIVMHLKESSATFSPPPPAPRKSVTKTQEQANQPSASVNNGLVSSPDADENGNHEGEAADGYSIYIRGLPMNATSSMLNEEFKKFGPIKNDGIQVRRNRQQGVCFGFVEFEVAIAVEKAIEACPIEIGGCQAFVEEKKSTNSRVNNRGRFALGRGSGFRNEGGRGRGNYGGGRGYSRNDFGGRNEYGNRGGNRGGSSNRGDGYQRSESVMNNGGRINRHAGIANVHAKNTAPRVSATA